MTRRLAIGLLVGLGVLAAAFVAGLGFLYSLRPEPPPEIAGLDPILTNFQLETLEGGSLGPPDLRGDVVVIGRVGELVQAVRPPGEDPGDAARGVRRPGE